MKCPKCGSENVTMIYCTETDKLPAKIVNNCLVCGKIWEKEHEPTTAEMLLWLAENESVDIWHTANKEIAIIWRNGEEYKFIFKTLAEAIKQAYDWAKQEEQNAEN